MEGRDLTVVGLTVEGGDPAPLPAPALEPYLVRQGFEKGRVLKWKRWSPRDLPIWAGQGYAGAGRSGHGRVNLKS